MNDKLSKVVLSPFSTMKDALKLMNANSMQIVLIVDNEQHLLGTVTDGDIRRAIINHASFQTAITDIMEKNPKYLYEYDRDKVGAFMTQHMVTQVPILDADNKLVDLILWTELAKENLTHYYPEKKVSVFIPAGGKGVRLRPFTNILPKPLIPLGDTPILEVIMNRFRHYGFNDFILSLNYKSEMIKMYFAENNSKFNIRYVQEEEFSGTAGSLYLVKNQIENTLLISNCDIIIDVNIDDFYNYHVNQKNDITIVGVIRHMKVPYGVMTMQESKLMSMEEKPEYDFIINAGVYALEPTLFPLIPDRTFVDMPDLILMAKNQGLKVGVYPISGEMIDVGRWEEYNTAVVKAKKLGFIQESEVIE